MNEEETIKEINFIVGAVDGKTRERVKRIINYLHLYQWAYGELHLVIDLQNIDGTSQLSDTERRRKEIREKLQSGLHEADLPVGGKYSEEDNRRGIKQDAKATEKERFRGHPSDDCHTFD